MTPEEIKNKIYNFLDKQDISTKDKYFIIKMIEQELLEDVLSDGEEEVQEDEDDFSDFEDEEEPVKKSKPVEDFMEDDEDDTEPKPLIKRPRVKVDN
jgi:hypothetical protein